MHNECSLIFSFFLSDFELYIYITIIENNHQKNYLADLSPSPLNAPKLLVRIKENYPPNNGLLHTRK